MLIKYPTFLCQVPKTWYKFYISSTPQSDCLENGILCSNKNEGTAATHVNESRKTNAE